MRINWFSRWDTSWQWFVFSVSQQVQDNLVCSVLFWITIGRIGTFVEQNTGYFDMTVFDSFYERSRTRLVFDLQVIRINVAK